MSTRPTILCISSYFKGNPFIERAKEEGCTVYLLTVEHLLGHPWVRDSIDEVFAVPTFADRETLLNVVAYIMRSRPIDRVVALDEFDVEVSGYLRDYFGWDGFGESSAGRFHDKLTMRQNAERLGVRQPAFTSLFVDAHVQSFLEASEGPWLLKPRGEAAAIGIRKLHTREDVWNTLHELGDARRAHLLECMVDGAMYHVDSLTAGGRVIFAEVNQYHRPLLEVAQGGGIYATRTFDRDAPLRAALRAANDAVLEGFGLGRGASHTEFIVGESDGLPYFIETSARVGGAHVADMVEAATGINLWKEWASLEALGGPNGSQGTYRVPSLRYDYAGTIISLARQEHPDTSSFADPEIVERLDKRNHIGFILRAAAPGRVAELLAAYRERIQSDFHAALPQSARPVD